MPGRQSVTLQLCPASGGRGDVLLTSPKLSRNLVTRQKRKEKKRKALTDSKCRNSPHSCFHETLNEQIWFRVSDRDTVRTSSVKCCMSRLTRVSHFVFVLSPLVMAVPSLALLLVGFVLTSAAKVSVCLAL